MALIQSNSTGRRASAFKKNESGSNVAESTLDSTCVRYYLRHFLCFGVGEAHVSWKCLANRANLENEAEGAVVDKCSPSLRDRHFEGLKKRVFHHRHGGLAKFFTPDS